MRVPTLSVVVTSSGHVETLSACLARLMPCCRDADAELIIVRAGPDTNLLSPLQQIPQPIVLTMPVQTAHADLRRVGLSRCTGDVISFVDGDGHGCLAATEFFCRAWTVWARTGGWLGAMARSPAGESVTGQAGGLARPSLSVVVPVHDGAATLAMALEAISRSDLPRESWELIVVDDASNDASVLIAAPFADRIVRLPNAPHGPGYARNRGFELTQAQCVAFIDGDVSVRSDTLQRFATVLRDETDVSAVFGSYDTRPAAPGFLSQYRDLLLHYHYLSGVGDSMTFWSACGAVRGATFEQAGRYNEWHFPRRQLEDLELGQRIRALGHRIVLRPEIQVTHLQHWTLRRLVATEIFDRGVPWMRLVNRRLERLPSGARTPRSIRRTNVSLTWLGAALALLGSGLGETPLLLGALACAVVVPLNNAAQFVFFRRQRGLRFALATVPLDFLFYVVNGLGLIFGWVAQHVLGEPRPDATTQALAELELKTWPPLPSRNVVPRDVWHQPLDSAPVPATTAAAHSVAGERPDGSGNDKRSA